MFCLCSKKQFCIFRRVLITKQGERSEARKEACIRSAILQPKCVKEGSLFAQTAVNARPLPCHIDGHEILMKWQSMYCTLDLTPLITKALKGEVKGYRVSTDLWPCTNEAVCSINPRGICNIQSQFLICFVSAICNVTHPTLTTPLFFCNLKQLLLLKKFSCTCKRGGGASTSFLLQRNLLL